MGRMFRKFAVAAVVLTAGFVFGAPAMAATVSDFTPAGFAAAQTSGAPVLVFVEASWCPTCAKIRPVLADLYKDPAFATLQVFDVNFDTQKDVVREFGVRMQSTLIAFHGGHEAARTTGVTDPTAIKDLLLKANS